MMLHFFVATISSMFLLKNHFVATENFHLKGFPIEPVEKLKIEKLSGRWFSAYSNLASKFLMNRVDKSCGTLDIYKGNEENMFHLVGSLQSLNTRYSWNGEGHLIGPEKNGKLKIVYEGMEALQEINSTFDENTTPNVLIISTGVEDNNENDQYDYLIATDPLTVSLSVFVKNKETLDKFDKKIQRELESFGFNLPETRPIPSNQEDCNYREDVLPLDENFKPDLMEGRLYMVIFNPFVQLMNDFMFHAKCIALDIKRKNKTSFDVIRSKLDLSTMDLIEEKENIIFNPSLPSQLKIVGPTSSSGLKMNILKTGNVNELTGQYNYIIASDQTRLGVAVLSSKKDILENEEDKKEILDFLEMEGYDKFYNAPMEVDHSKCRYRSIDESKMTSNIQVFNEWEYVRFRGVLAY